MDKIQYNLDLKVTFLCDFEGCCDFDDFPKDNLEEWFRDYVIAKRAVVTDIYTQKTRDHYYLQCTTVCSVCCDVNYDTGVSADFDNNDFLKIAYETACKSIIMPGFMQNVIPLVVLKGIQAIGYTAYRDDRVYLVGNIGDYYCGGLNV